MTEHKTNLAALVTSAGPSVVGDAAGLTLATLAREGVEAFFQVVAIEHGGDGLPRDVVVFATVSAAAAKRVAKGLADSGLASGGYRVDVFDPRTETGWRPLP